jgi:tetratricopeptide (TPR) repeat protein
MNLSFDIGFNKWLFHEKHDGMNPATYDTAIKKQLDCARKHPKDAEQWLALGRLYEAKLDATHSLKKSNFSIRYFIPLYFLFILSVFVIASYIFSTSFYFMFSIRLFLVSSFMIFASIMAGSMWSLRYPQSGGKYFRKAIAIDSCCAEAYMHLGLMALRRRRKQTACRYLDRALELNLDNRKIEREFKTIYETEFLSFFNKKNEKEIGYQKIIEGKINETNALRSKVFSYERHIESLGGKVDQTKWEVNHKTKQVRREMNDRLEAVQREYEKQIEDIKRSYEETQDTEDSVQKDVVRLTAETMETEAKLETSTFADAENAVEKIMGSDKWQSFLPQTRTYLATAEHTFRMLSEEEDTPDYSLIGMELCKALEAEINRTLVFPFLESLNGDKREFLTVNQVGESKGKPRYFTYLAQIIDQRNYPEVSTLTLGQYHFVLKRALKGEYALRKYRDFLDHFSKSSNAKIGKSFLKNLETVTNRYRNTIAHESPMNKKQCNHLRGLIFSGNEALLKTCSKPTNH